MKTIKLVVLLALTFAGTVLAEDSVRYIVILKHRTSPAPDVAALGGKIEGRQDEQLVVSIPAEAVAKLKAEPSVLYLQRVGGEPVPLPMEPPLMGVPAEPEPGTAAAPRRLTPHPQGSTPWDSGTYSYDGAGNITVIGSDIYVYDPVQRLKHSTTGGIAEDYTYDGFGNMKTKTNATIPQVDPPRSNRYQGYSYNAIGAVTNDGTYDLAWWDALGQPLSKRIISTNVIEYYVYTANDERIGVQRNNWWTWSVRDESGKVLRQYRRSSTTPAMEALWLEDYVWRDGLLLGSQRPAEMGGRRHFHLDHLGTPRLITADSGQRISQHTYYPFGDEQQPIVQEGPSAAGLDREEPMKFTGHERDFAGGQGAEDTHYIDYMRARYYSALQGRFLSVDPLIPKGAMRAPQLWNRYSYVANNPMTRVDPDGKLLQIAGCADTKSETCQKNYNLYLSTFGKQSQDAAKYLQLGKNGIVSFKGMAGAIFAMKFGTMGRASNFLISNRAATFSISTDASRVDHSGGNNATTRYGNVGAEIAIDLAGYPQRMGGISQSATGALAHELGHALGTLIPGIRDAFDQELGHTVWTQHEGFATAFENQWRAEQGMDQRLFYKYMYGDVGHTRDDVFDWPKP